jgi:hypothetical protein
MIATFIKKGPCVDIGTGYAVEIGIARPTAGGRSVSAAPEGSVRAFGNVGD